MSSGEIEEVLQSIPPVVRQDFCLDLMAIYGDTVRRYLTEDYIEEQFPACVLQNSLLLQMMDVFRVRHLEVNEALAHDADAPHDFSFHEMIEVIIDSSDFERRSFEFCTYGGICLVQTLDPDNLNLYRLPRFMRSDMMKIFGIANTILATNDFKIIKKMDSVLANTGTQEASLVEQEYLKQLIQREHIPVESLSMMPYQSYDFYTTLWREVQAFATFSMIQRFEILMASAIARDPALMAAVGQGKQARLALESV
jgi:hypothetical protein